jgi:hypothetical protein
MNRQGMVAKVLVRALVAAAFGGFLLVEAAGPAMAATPAGGGGTVEAMAPLEVLGIYAGIPIGLFALITLLVMAPSLIRGAGQQQGVAWDGQPAWFGARADEGVPTLAATSSDEDAEPATREPATADEPDSADGSTGPGSGGAGGRW